MAGEGSVFRRCGCTDPVTGRQFGTRCPRQAAGGRHGSWYVRLELPGRAGRAAPPDPARRLPVAQGRAGVLARLRNPKARRDGQDR